MKRFVSDRSIFFLIAVLTSRISFAQEFRGTLSGHVLDPSGGLIPNVSIEAVNTATGQSYKATTNASGAYTIPYVLPGSYSVTAAVQGFKTSVQSGAVVQAGVAPVLDFKLELGETTQTVSVF